MNTEVPYTAQPKATNRATSPTLMQVAARAGVSLKTASRAVNGEPRVAEQTRARVLDAAHDLGFQLNRAASLLARGIVSNVVALITGDLSNPFYAALAKGVEQELRTKEFQLTVASSDEEPHREKELIDEFVTRQVRALILVSTIDDHRALQPIQERGIPVVFVDRRGIGIGADSVVLDNREGTRAAIEYLIHRGHRSIGFIGDLSRLETHRERFEGFVEAMSAHGLDPNRWERHGAHNLETARKTCLELLTQPHPPSALFTSNNRITVGALQTMSELGVSPALIGFDDFELADVLGVTVVAHDPVDMGRIAAHLALEAIERRAIEPRSVVIPTRLVIRGSGERTAPD